MDQPRDMNSIEALLARLGERSIVLVGLMGCGESSVGRRLASRLGLGFVDADEEIERVAEVCALFDTDKAIDQPVRE